MSLETPDISPTDTAPKPAEESYGYRIKQLQKRLQAMREMSDTQEMPIPPAEEAPSLSLSTTSKIITEPVRSGQQIYARGGDLIVLASVSPGAEILADGNIHVYGVLSGRALAGVQGNTQAHIFCKTLNAELVAIAGQYKVKEDLDFPNTEGVVDIYLENDCLKIRTL